MQQGCYGNLRLRADRSDGFFRLRWHRVCHHGLPVAAFLQATAHRANLGFLFDDERRAALRTRLRERHVRRGEIAIRVARAAVENARAPATALAGAAAAHELTFIALRAFDAQGDGARVFALGIAGATDELAEAPVLFYQAVAAQRALFLERLVGLVGDARSCDQAPRGFAIGIPGAGEKRAKAAALDGHFLAAVVAILGFAFAVGIVAELRRHILNEIAVRIARAAQEKSVPADALQQLALAALLAFFPRRDSRLVRNHLVAGFGQIHDKFFPELPNRHTPG